MALEQEEQVDIRLPDEPAPDERQEAVQAAIVRTQGYLLSTQAPEGWWCGELESNVTITAEYLFLTHFLGVANAERWAKIAAYLREQQRGDGTWGIYYDAPGDLSTTIEAYFALKLAGASPDEPAMQRAREFILSKGGVPKTRVFTKIWLALLGQYDWRGLPVMPPELIFLPSWCPFNIYDFACWARETIVPMLILLTEQPVRPVPQTAVVDELYCRPEDRLDWSLPKKPTALLSWRRFFLGADAILRRLERSRWKPFRQAARRACERWIIAHQEADGSWGGIQPPWVYSLLALHVLGHPVTDAVMAKGLQGFEDFAIEDERTFRTQSCMSPVWDTCLAATALLDSGLPPDHPALTLAGSFLLNEQIFSGGDWQVRQKGWQHAAPVPTQAVAVPPPGETAPKGLRPPSPSSRTPLSGSSSDLFFNSAEEDDAGLPGVRGTRAGGFGGGTPLGRVVPASRFTRPARPGGWAFEFQNDLYPDTDDTAEVLLALRRIIFPPEVKERQVIALERGTEWLLGMQSSRGGFASFDIDNTRRAITQIPFCDFGEVIDPPSEDVTAHILEWFGALGLPGMDPHIAAALRYLKREQQADGSWWGRWGVNYVYGTGAVLPALRALGEDMRQPYIQRAANWLLSCQQDNGGWGESCASYEEPAKRGTGAPTASQTAWALLGLLAVQQGGATNERIGAAIERGIGYLLEQQEADGTWAEPYFTGTGFPRAFMIKYHLYRVYFPLMALGRYLEQA
ncbi:MAG TPA: terpene cyclase/mutase family protein [Ktedonobacterales bacterium]|nr:terpene cyclase/mutase family protein [Ktedonobacterales bacterium]